MAVVNTKVGTADTITSVMGNGVTWVCDAGATSLHSGDSVLRVSMCRAMGASPTTGTATISFGINVEVQIHWNYIQCTGVNTGGTNGSAAFLNPTFASVTGASSVTVTLPTFAQANDVPVLYLGTDGDPGTITPGSGFTSLGQVAPGFTRSFGEVGGANDNTADASWGDPSQKELAIAIEVRAP